MSSPASCILYTTAVILGATTHLLYFTKGEHHLYGVRYLEIFALSFVAATLLDVRVNRRTLIDAITVTSFFSVFYITGLFSSTICYRLFLHPLKAFPGPVANKLGNLFFSAQLGNADAYKKVLALHDQYGDFVRIGSSDLSIIHPKAVNVIYGTGTRCLRAAFYNGDPLPSMISCRDRLAHDKRRRVWSPAFSDRALKGYAQRIKVYDDQLLSKLKNASSAADSVNVSKWFNYYSFDVMGDLAFGKPFGMLECDQQHWAVSLMNTGLEALAFLFPIWLFRVLVAIPGLLRDHEKIVEFCNDQLEERMKVGAQDDSIEA